jgi:hypothetical protein
MGSHAGAQVRPHTAQSLTPAAIARAEAAGAELTALRVQLGAQGWRADDHWPFDVAFEARLMVTDPPGFFGLRYNITEWRPAPEDGE